MSDPKTKEELAETYTASVVRPRDRYQTFQSYDITDAYLAGYEAGETACQSQVEELERIANEWMRDYDKLKAKYEPMIVVTSAPEKNNENNTEQNRTK